MQHPELARPHDLLVRRFLTDPELMADLVRYYPQKPADKNTVELLDLKHLECKSPVAVDEQLTEGIGDLRFSTSFKGTKRQSNVFLLFEHQSKIDPSFRLRGLDYIVRSYKEFRGTTKGKKKLPYPVVIVLYHGKVPWSCLPEMDELIDRIQTAESGLLKYPLILIDISVIPLERFGGHPVLQSVLESLQLASTNRLVGELDRVIGRLVPVKNDPRVKGWLRSLTRYAMSVAKVGTEQVARAFSTIFTEREADDMAKTMLEQLLLEGEARGEAKGKAEGKAEAGRSMVLAFIRAKFKRIPKDVEKAILAMNDPVALESLAAHAGESETLDEFADALQ